jgi:hypothetical protein
MNAHSELSRYYELEAIQGIEGCWYYKNETPAHAFHNVIKQANVPSKEVVISVTARDFFDRTYALNIIAFVEAKLRRFSPSQPLSVLDSFQAHGDFKFDSIGMITSEAHTLFKRESPLLHPHTLVVYPMFRCEFSGKEDSETIVAMRRDFIATIDWKRPRRCKILARYRNSKTGTGTLDKHRVLENQETLFREIAELTPKEGSFIEIENYQGDVLEMIVNPDGNYRIKVTSRGVFERSLSKSEIIDLTIRFLSGEAY